jgi:hypothetical protein
MYARWLIAAALVAIACKGKGDGKDPAGTERSADPASGNPAMAIDWTACESALRAAIAAPPPARPGLVIEGCRVCGDFAPLLAWSTLPEDGGPTRGAIEQAMLACNGYCNGNAKQRFLGTLDKARGSDARTPWRQLGEVCRAEVSALPDSRFMSAPYFALDRIGRAVATRGGTAAELLAALELPLPAVTISGTGVMLPELARGVVGRPGTLHVTVLAGTVHVGKLPRARLGGSGVTVDLGPFGYPGSAVEPGALAARLRELGGDHPGEAILVLAPHAMPAIELVPIFAAASTVAPVYLAAGAHDGPEGWQLPTAIPVALDPGGPDPIGVTDETTVQELATELSGRAGQNPDRIGIVAR